MKSLNLLLLFGAVLFISSCSKDEVQSSENTTSITKRHIDSPSSPSLANGVLKFDDFGELDAYYHEASELLENDMTSFMNTTSFDIETIHSKVENEEFEDPSNQYNPKVNDPILMSILNTEYEIQVGERIVKFLDDSRVVYINADDQALRSNVNNVVKSNGFTINDLPKNALIGSSKNLEESLKPVCGCEINYETIDCNSFRISGQCRNFIQQADEFVLEVYLESSAENPSTAPEFVHTGEGNFNFVFDVPDSQDDIFVHASVNPQCWAGLTRWYHADEPFGSDQCDGENRYTNWEWVQQPGEPFAISHKTSAYKNLWGSHEKAHLKSLQYSERRGRWIRDRAPLNIGIQAYRNDDSCDPIDWDYIIEADFCTNCSSIIAYQKTLQDTRYCTQDVIGVYGRIEDTYQLQATVELEFVCCN